jgi:hypothetical protein
MKDARRIFFVLPPTSLHPFRRQAPPLLHELEATVTTHADPLHTMGELLTVGTGTGVKIPQYLRLSLVDPGFFYL